MAPQNHVVLGKPARISPINLRLRRGGPGKRRPTPNRDDRSQLYRTGDNIMNMHSSHMPLDTMLHWQWTNPLNLIPLLVGTSMMLAVIGMFV